MSAGRHMRVGLMLPIGMGSLGDGGKVPWGVLREMAEVAEAVGFASLVVPDHLLFRRSPPGNSPMLDLPEGRTRGIWEAWTVLSAVAAVTRRVTLSPFVACTAFRNPALLAKMADTLDEVSGGRLVLGLGAGWHEPEFDAFGVPFDHRVSRFEEALGIIVPLLREGKVDFAGRYYQARQCELAPRGPRPAGPPILIGAQGPRMLGLVARHADRFDADFQLDPAALAPRFAALEAACRAAGRDPGAIGRGAGARVALAPDGGRADPGPAQVGPARDGIAQFEVAGVRFAARQDSPEALARWLRGFEAASVEHLTLSLVAPSGARGIERFAGVLELLRRPAPA
jgi:alkanesulfonate monooxygenase SsuD/methylene tetrahydromethanopterin reductase-like flavin-dependent oxidoreductase (luciferase family)